MTKVAIDWMMQYFSKEIKKSTNHSKVSSFDSSGIENQKPQKKNSREISQDFRNEVNHETNNNTHAKIFLRAITQSNFEFFEEFAINFNKAMYNVVTTSSDKRYINKFIFEIIEKCIIKTNYFEKVNRLSHYNISFTFVGLLRKNQQNCT